MDKYDRNTWRKIYDAIDEPYFNKVYLFTEDFLEIRKNSTNAPQNITY